MFFIVLDLRLTRLGYGGIPFFLCLCVAASMGEVSFLPIITPQKNSFFFPCVVLLPRGKFI